MSDLNKFIHERLFKKCCHEWEAAKVDRYVYALCKKCSATASIDAQPQIPDYASDISAAFKIIEELAKRELHFRLLTKGCSSGLALAEVYRIAGNVLYGECRAETLPEAICLAAKQALEGVS